jgi:hypothetical protein
VGIEFEVSASFVDTAPVPTAGVFPVEQIQQKREPEVGQPVYLLQEMLAGLVSLDRDRRVCFVWW